MKRVVLLSAALTTLSAQSAALEPDETVEADRTMDLSGLVRLEGAAPLTNRVPIDRIHIDAMKSIEPTTAEWSNAMMVDDLPSGCGGMILREWLRVSCTTNSGALIAGSAEDIRLTKVDGEVIIVMRIAPGDRRLIELRNLTDAPAGYGGGRFGAPALSASSVLSETWLADSPEIIMNSAP